MELKHLNSHQTVLLCILVSFVTAIATGITTTVLLAEAPPVITQTINRVVEKTVERVVPAEAPDPVTKKVTVVIKEEDLIVDAVSENAPFVVSVGTRMGSGGDGDPVYIARTAGLLVVQGKYAVVSAEKLPSDSYVLVEGKWRKTTKIHYDDTNTIAVLEIERRVSEGEGTSQEPFVFAKKGNIKLGQTAIAISRDRSGDTRVLTGVVSHVPASQETNVPPRILSTLSVQKDFSEGILINLDGEVVGINTSFEDGQMRTVLVNEDILQMILSENQTQAMEQNEKTRKQTATSTETT